MKSILIFLGIILLSVSLIAQDDYQLAIEKARNEKDVELQSRKTSPLQKEDRKTFQNLPYFDIDPAWRLEAKFVKSESAEIIEIPTSAGYSKTFQAYGRFEVMIDDNYFPLIAYKRVIKEGQPSPEHESLFLPFKDNTTGESTYGGGRYLDLEIPKDGEMAVIDFNLCYSPYCAYGGGFACPIPPNSNYIKAEVTAGEKAYPSH